MSSDPARARTGQGSAARRSHRGSWVPVPHSRKAGGQSGRAVAETLRALRRALHLEPLEEGPAQPGVDEPLDVARGLELVGQVLVGAAPACTFGRVLNACGHADEDDMAQRQIGADRHMQRHPGTERVAEQGARLVADLPPAPPPPRDPLSPAGRPAPNPESPCPGRSTATRVCDSARRSPKRPQRRPVCVKPCSRTSGGPEPRTSTWSGTSGERTGHLQRHLGGRVGPARGHRCRRLRRIALDAAGPALGRSTAGPRPPRRAQRGILRARGWRWRRGGRPSSA